MLKIGDEVILSLNLGLGCFRVLLKTGKFFNYEGDITIAPTKFHVDEEERLELINNNVPSTHAWVEGVVVDFEKYDKSLLCGTVDYNPHKFDHFYSVECGMRYHDQGHLINFQIDNLKGNLVRKSSR